MPRAGGNRNGARAGRARRRWRKRARAPFWGRCGCAVRRGARPGAWSCAARGGLQEERPRGEGKGRDLRNRARESRQFKPPLRAHLAQQALLRAVRRPAAPEGRVRVVPGHARGRGQRRAQEGVLRPAHIASGLERARARLSALRLSRARVEVSGTGGLFFRRARNEDEAEDERQWCGVRFCNNSWDAPVSQVLARSRSARGRARPRPPPASTPPCSSQHLQSPQFTP